MDKDFFDAIDEFQSSNVIDNKEPKLLDQELICECHCISAADIRSLLGSQEVLDLETLKGQFLMGTACGSCIRDKDRWMHRVFRSDEICV